MLEALSTPSPKWYRPYIGNSNNYNNTFFPWVWCTSFVLYFFCGIHALTSLPSKNTVTYNLAVVIRYLPGFKEETVDYIVFRTAEMSPKRSYLGGIPREITDIYAHSVCSYPYGSSHPIRKLIPDFSWSDQWYYLIPGRHSGWPQLTGQGCYKWEDCPRFLWGPRQNLYNHQYILLHMD